jgi:hypothetical protein
MSSKSKEEYHYSLSKGDKKWRMKQNALNGTSYPKIREMLKEN